MDDQKPPTDDFLTRVFRRASLPGAARRRHLKQLDEWAVRAGETSRRSHLLELGVITTIIVAVLAFAVWQLGLPGSESPSPAGAPGEQAMATGEQVSESAILQPTPPSSGTAPPAGSAAVESAAPTPSPRQPGGASEHDAVATAMVQGCQMTPLAASVPSDLAQYFQGYTDWAEQNGIWVSPQAFFGGSWHAGTEMDTAWYSDELGQLSATVRSLNDPSLRFDVTNTDTSHDPDLIFALISFPEPGCWEIDATLGDRQATFIVNVLSYEARPDVQLFINTRQAMIPYPVPAACNVNPWTGPETRESYGIFYWIDSNGIAMRDLSGVFFEGEEELTIQRLGDARAEITARNDNGQIVNFEESLTSGRGGEAWVGKGFFPSPGCWHIGVEMEGRTFTATIFVYPAACRLEEGPVSAQIFNGQEVERPAECVEE